MTDNTSVTAQFGAGERGELLPCPFCGSEIMHIESWARSFDPPRLYHEWHHAKNDVGCPISSRNGSIVARATDDIDMQKEVVLRWNTRAAPVSHTSVKDGGGAATAQEFTPRDAWDELVHKDDRTSPEEYPDHCLISFEELQDFMSRERGPEPEPTKEDFAKWSRVWHDTCETILTLLDLPGSGSPQETLAQVQAYAGTRPPAQAPEQPTGSDAVADGAVMGKPRVVGHTELCLFLLPFLQQGDFTVEALVTAILADFQVIDRAALRSAPVKAVGSEALRLLAAEDARQEKLHELLETIREQIRLGVEPEHRPDGLFQNIQDAVYAMRGRTLLMNDVAITAALATPQAPAQFGAGERGEPDLAKLSQRALQFRLGTRRLFEEGQTKGDMWFFELWHFLGDVQDALAAPVSHTSVKDGGDLPPDWKQDQAETSRLPRKSTGSDAVADGARETIDRAVMAELTRQHDAGVKYLSGINVDDLVSAIQSVAPVKAVGSESLRDLLREARQYVSDAGVDDDPETKRNSSSLLSAIDTALAHPTMATHHD